MEASIHIFENYLRRHIQDTQLELDIPSILEVFHFVTIPKNQFLVEEGNICPYFCFIESGILQHSITVEGEEKTTYLALKNTATSALKSFKNRIPSRKNIKAISDCSLWVITFEHFNDLLKNNKAFYMYYYGLIENQIFLIDDYRIDLLIRSPEERYKKILMNDPELVQKVPLHYLASFLGISARHMSRIRKNII